MKGSGRNSVHKRKPSRAKSSAHIIGELKELRREMPSKREFPSHISREGYLSCGVGLVLWFIKDKVKKNESGKLEFYLSSRFAEKLCPRQKHGEPSITKSLREAGIIKVLRPGVAGLCNAHY